MTDYGGQAPLSYNKYLKVQQLIELQEKLALPEKHDELLFIIIHQTFELWFKQILHELDATISYINERRIMRAIRNIGRVCEIEKVLINQFKILETMTPHDFLLFREELKPASGFQSTQFREIEFVSGTKDEKMINHFRDDEFAYERLSKRFDAPSLADEFWNLLSRKDFSTGTNDERVQTIVEILTHPEKHADYFIMQDLLIEHDENIALWRYNHVLMVERMLGMKRGTGGSEGAGYLRTTLSKKFFPELWEARTHL